MIDIETKVDGVSTMPASEMNSMVSELESIITTGGLTLDSGSVVQIAEAIARYAAGGASWYTDSGTADTYVLASVLTFNTPEAYFEGMTVGCVANVTSTSAGSTINVNSIGSVSLLDADGSALVASSVVSGTTFFARYDATAVAFKFTIESGIANLFADPNPILSNTMDTGGFSIDLSEGASVASVASPNIWAGDGDTIHITGTTTITDFTDAPRIGARKTIIFDAALTFTTGSGITLQGGENIITEAGDFAEVYADAVDAFTVVYHRISGSGKVLQIAFAQFSAVSTSTSIIPQDDTIPQSTEGLEIMTLAFTPKSATSTILIEVVENGHHENTGRSIALFKDSDASAIAAGFSSVGIAGNGNTLSFIYSASASSTTLRTYKVRGGGNSTATYTFNGISSARLFGAITKSSIKITEISA